MQCAECSGYFDQMQTNRTVICLNFIDIRRTLNVCLLLRLVSVGGFPGMMKVRVKWLLFLLQLNWSWEPM